MQPFPQNGAAPENAAWAEPLCATHFVQSSMPINDNLVFYRQYPGKLDLHVLYCLATTRTNQFRDSFSPWIYPASHEAAKQEPEADNFLQRLKMGRNSEMTQSGTPLGPQNMAGARHVLRVVGATICTLVQELEGLSCRPNYPLTASLTFVILSL